MFFGEESERGIVIEDTSSGVEGTTVNIEAITTGVNTPLPTIEVVIMLVGVGRNFTCSLTDDLLIENDKLECRSYVNMSISSIHLQCCLSNKNSVDFQKARCLSKNSVVFEIALFSKKLRCYLNLFQILLRCHRYKRLHENAEH